MSVFSETPCRFVRWRWERDFPTIVSVQLFALIGFHSRLLSCLTLIYSMSISCHYPCVVCFGSSDSLSPWSCRYHLPGELDLAAGAAIGQELGVERATSQCPQTGGRYHHGRLCHRSVLNAAPASTNRRTAPSWPSVPQVCTERSPSVHKQEDGTIMAVCATGLYRTRSQCPQTGGRYHHGRLCHRSVLNAVPVSTNRRTAPSWPSVPQVTVRRKVMKCSKETTNTIR